MAGGGQGYRRVGQTKPHLMRFGGCWACIRFVKGDWVRATGDTPVDAWAAYQATT